MQRNWPQHQRLFTQKFKFHTCIVTSGVRYRKIPYHDYYTPISCDTIHIAIYSYSLSLCIYTDDTCIYHWCTGSTIQHGSRYITLHTLLSIKITVYNGILGTFLSKICTRLISRYKNSISYHDIKFYIMIFRYIYRISHITNSHKYRG